MTTLPAPLPLALTRTAWRLDLWLDGHWAPQLYWPDARGAYRQMNQLARSRGGTVTWFEDAEGAGWRWPGGGIRAVRCEVDA